MASVHEIADSDQAAHSSVRIFLPNLWCAAACATVVSLAGFSYLRAELPTSIEVALELLACTVFAIDIFLHAKSQTEYFQKLIGKIAVVAAMVPWYAIALVFLNEHNSKHPLVLLFAHASFAPYLFLRFKALSREHMVPRRIKILLFSILFFFTLHWLAVAWMCLNPRPDVDFVTEYNMAVYFLMTTLTTIGYGDITPQNNISRIFTMLLQLMGVGVFGLVIGQVSQMIVNADRRREHNRNKLEALTSLIKHYDLPIDLERKTYKFFRHVLSRSSNEEEQQVLALLPHALQTEIQVYMNAKPLARVSLFKGCTQASLIDAAKGLEQEYFAPDKHIIRKGDVGETMYLIGHGRVRIHDGDHFIAELGDGQCFGEMALIEGEVRKADVTALTHCDVFKLSKSQFHELIESHVDLRANVAKLASVRTTKAS